MKTLKNITKMFKFYLGWLFYFLITIKQRLMYLYSKTYNTNVVDIEDSMFHTTISYRPSEKPKRQYITFKEYKKFIFKKCLQPNRWQKHGS